MDTAEIILKAQKILLEDQDGLTAEELLLKAANRGDGHAAHELGVLYGVGCGELKANLEKGRYWLEKSLELGFEKTVASDPEWFKNEST